MYQDFTRIKLRFQPGLYGYWAHERRRVEEFIVTVDCRIEASKSEVGSESAFGRSVDALANVSVFQVCQVKMPWTVIRSKWEASRPVMTLLISASLTPPKGANIEFRYQAHRDLETM